MTPDDIKKLAELGLTGEQIAAVAEIVAGCRKNNAAAMRAERNRRYYENKKVVPATAPPPAKKAAPSGDLFNEPPVKKPKPVKTPTSQEAIRLANLFRRKLTTPWTDKEIKAFKGLYPIAESDLSVIEEYYNANWPPVRDGNVLRHDLATLLNNWPGEVDRANTWAIASKKAASTPSGGLFVKRGQC